MPRTSPHKYLRRTNKDNTCKWCGRATATVVGIGQDENGKNRGRTYGYVEGQWNFCTNHCCEMFARAMIKNGYLLEEYEGHPFPSRKEANEKC